MDQSARGCGRVRRPRDQARGQRLPDARPRRIRQHRRAQKPPRTFPRLKTPSPPRQRRPFRHSALVCAARHYHARDGIHRHPRKRPPRRGGVSSLSGERGRLARTVWRLAKRLFAPSGLAATPTPRRKLRRQHSERNHPRIRPQRSRSRPRHHPRQHQPPRARADDHRPQFPRQNQRQHRQQRRRQLHRRRSRENALGHQVGRRHRHGPLHRQKHPRHPRMDHPQLRPSPSAPSPSTRRSRK